MTKNEVLHNLAKMHAVAYGKSYTELILGFPRNAFMKTMSYAYDFISKEIPVMNKSTKAIMGFGIDDFRGIDVAPIDAFDNPVKLIMDEINFKCEQELQNKVYSACTRIGVEVDDEKLAQALSQDRERYMEAYNRGYRAGQRNALEDMERYEKKREELEKNSRETEEN